MCPECQYPNKCIIGLMPRPSKRRADICPVCLSLVSRSVSQIDYDDEEFEVLDEGRVDEYY